MFLLKRQFPRSQFSLSNNKLEEALKKAIPEIKKHQPKNYYNPRNFLMQNTKRLIKSSETARPSRQEIDGALLEGDSGKKEVRRVSLRNYRSRLSKSNGFATCSKLNERKRDEECVDGIFDEIQKRYDEEQNEEDRQTTIRRNWLGGVMRNQKCSEIGVTNIKFQNDSFQLSSSRVMKQRRREKVEKGRRPNTTGEVNRFRLTSDDNVIEPW